MSTLFLPVRLWALNQRFLGGRGWYQFIEFQEGITTGAYCGPNGIERTQSFEKWLRDSSILKRDDVVLDLGSNAAWLSVVVAELVSHVKAVEIDGKFNRQARFVLSYFAGIMAHASKVSLFQADINKSLELLEDVTVVLASKFLYHRDFASQIGAFMERVEKSNVRAMIIQGHVTQGSLGEEAGIAELLSSYGFDYREGSGGTVEYPIGIATRRGVR